MTTKIIEIIGIYILISAGFLWAEEIYELDLRRHRETEKGLSLASAEAADEQVQVLDFKAQISFLPVSTRLVCRTDLVLKRLHQGNEPLALYFDAQKMETRMDSVRSIVGVDSVEIYSDSMLFYQGAVEAGQIDTLTFWFANQADFRGRLQPNPMVDTLYASYYGLFYWSPFPSRSSFDGGFKVSFDITVPEGYAAVSPGELQRTWEPAPGQKCYEWRMQNPAKDAPIFVVDTYRVKHYERNGMHFNIYHFNAPDSLLDTRMEWHFETCEKYITWYGGINYQTVNMVELVQWDYQRAPYFSVPGTFFVPSGHLGGKNYIPGNTPYLMHKLQSHELAHQWWGHRVWSPEHYYMSEGWAEFSALRAVLPEKNELKNRYRNNLQKSLKLMLGTKTDKPLVETPPVGDTSLFYLKGPWVLYMLECLMGEETYLSSLKEFQSGFAYQDNSLINFFSILERNSGRDLSWFRREWYEKAGYPQVKLRQSYHESAGGLSGRTVLEQSGTLFDIPLELGVFPKGQIDPEIIVVHLETAKDTLELPLTAIPDSVRLDPGIKTLIDVIYPPEITLAPRGAAPAGQSCRLELYLDSTSVYRDVTLFFKAGEAGWDSIRVQAPGLPGGFLSVELPPQNSGVSVDYFIRVTNASGLEFQLPEGAPASPARVEFRILPRAGRRAMATFEPRLMNTDFRPSGEDPFPAHRTGLICFDPEDLRVFGTLYGVGNLAPVVDSKQKYCYSYNWFTNTVDVVDLNAWKITRKIPVPADSRGIDIGYDEKLFSVLDEARNILYLHDVDCLYRIDLITGAVLISAGTEGGNDLGMLPNQFEIHLGKNILLLKMDYKVQLYDRDSGDLLREINMTGYNEFPHLMDDGTLLTAELYHNLDDYIAGRTVRHHLIVRHDDITGTSPVLIDSTHSRELEFSLRSPYPIGGGSTRFLDNGNTLIMEVMDTRTALLIWEWTRTDSVSRFDFEYERYHSNAVYRSASNGRTVFTLSGDHNTLALIDLDPPQMRIPYFSPYTGEILNSQPWYSNRLMSVITPPGDQETGDVDGSGRTDIYDLLDLLKALKAGASHQGFDLDFNGKLDIFDLLALLKLLSN